ncbi:MAG: hypothetical protein IIZ93_03705 [Acidaminococcaceae bacterium]|nr:hypothetical protein [Acidaminococcaceae bacterium]
MTINDGKGLWDKYGLISEIKTKMEVLADAKGTLRCGLIWDITNMVKALEGNLKKDDEAQAAKVEELKRIIEHKQEVVDDGAV